MKQLELSAQELRIGNYFLYDNRIQVVNGVIDINGGYRIDFKTEHKRKLVKYCHPIPLTEEWLLKFHPNALDLSNQIFRVGRFKLIWKFAYNYWYIVDYITGFYMAKLDFVHEWQNFWHIMNGEELTINK